MYKARWLAECEAVPHINTHYVVRAVTGREGNKQGFITGSCALFHNLPTEDLTRRYLATSAEPVPEEAAGEHTHEEAHDDSVAPLLVSDLGHDASYITELH